MLPKHLDARFLSVAGAMVLAVVAVLILPPRTAPQVGGPALSPSTSAAPPIAASQSSSPTASPVAGCHLVWSIDGVEDTAASRRIDVKVVNTGSDTCAGFSVMIGVTLTAANGSLIASAGAQNGPMFVLDPGRTANGFTQWTNWCGGTPPAGPLTLTINTDSSVQPAPFTADPPPCDAIDEPSVVTPMEAVIAPATPTSTSTPTPIPIPTFGPAPTSTPTLRPAPTPSPTLTATPADQCSFGWSISGVEETAGSRSIDLKVVVDGYFPCTLNEAPGVILSASDGTVIAQSAATPSAPLEFGTHGSATGVVQWQNWCGPQAPMSLTLTVTLIGSLAPIQFVADPPPCTSPGKPSTISSIQLTLDKP